MGYASKATAAKGKKEATPRIPQYRNYTREQVMEEMAGTYDLTWDEQNALMGYKTTGYSLMNAYLNGEAEVKVMEGSPKPMVVWTNLKGEEESTYQELMDYQIKTLDNLFKNKKLGRDMILYRGFDKDALKDAKPGDIITLPALTSTSTDKEVAHKFAKEKKGALATINVPGEANAIAVEPALDNYTPFRQMASFDVQRESEILLSRGAKYRVDSVKGRNGNRVELTYIGG